ncbi:MAG: sigma-54 dependent transcriptional regulator [Planctomycetota bacterium]
MARILVIDDEPGICRAFEKHFEKQGHEVRVSSRAETAIRLAGAFAPDLIILDVRLPGMSGLEALGRLRPIDPTVPIIVVTAYGTMETAVEAVRRGAWDYILKPLDLVAMGEVIERALDSRRLAEEIVIGSRPEVAPPAPRPERPREGFAPLLGRTPGMQEVFKSIGAASLTDAPVLIVGESGTGKEMTARAIHYSSSRADRPFEPMNCGAVPGPRILREIFGAPGQPGRLVRAEGGTVYLAEVHALPPTAQSDIARLLEEGSYEAGEEGKREPLTARVMASMTRDPDTEVAEGRFRQDLFYRLGVVTLRIPPLRERRADIPLLIGRFLDGRGGGGAAMTKEALRTLLEYSWPGNVTELRNAIERSVVMSRGGTILPEHLPEHVIRGADLGPEEDSDRIRGIVDRALENDPPEEGVFQVVMDRFEAPLIAAVLERTGGNQVQAAKVLGIHRTTLRTKIRKHGL